MRPRCTNSLRTLGIGLHGRYTNRGRIASNRRRSLESTVCKRQSCSRDTRCGSQNRCKPHCHTRPRPSALDSGEKPNRRRNNACSWQTCNPAVFRSQYTPLLRCSFFLFQLLLFRLCILHEQVHGKISRAFYLVNAGAARLGAAMRTQACFDFFFRVGKAVRIRAALTLCAASIAKFLVALLTPTRMSSRTLWALHAATVAAQPSTISANTVSANTSLTGCMVAAVKRKAVAVAAIAMKRLAFRLCRAANASDARVNAHPC